MRWDSHVPWDLELPGQNSQPPSILGAEHEEDGASTQEPQQRRPTSTALGESRHPALFYAVSPTWSHRLPPSLTQMVMCEDTDENDLIQLQDILLTGRELDEVVQVNNPSTQEAEAGPRA